MRVDVGHPACFRDFQSLNKLHSMCLYRHYRSASFRKTNKKYMLIISIHIQFDLQGGMGCDD